MLSRIGRTGPSQRSRRDVHENYGRVVDLSDAVYDDRPNVFWFESGAPTVDFLLPRPCRLVYLRSILVGVAGQFRVGQALADDLPNSQVEAIPIVHVFAVVVAERLFVQIAKHVERFNRNVGTADTALQKTPKVLQSVGMYVPIDVGNGMVDHLMSVVSSESIVGSQRIGMERGPGFNVLSDFGLECMLLAVRNDGGTDLAATLNDSDNGGFVFGASSGNPATTLPDVHVAGLTADESLIDFDFASQFPAVFALQSEARPVKHEPRGFLSNSQCSVNLKRTNSVLAVRDEPYAGKPLIETNRGLLEDSPDFDGELSFRMPTTALPAPLIRQETDLVTSAGRASNSVRPAPRNDVIDAVVGIGKVDDCGLKGFRFNGFHKPILPHNRVLRKYIVTLIRAPPDQMVSGKLYLDEPQEAILRQRLRKFQEYAQPIGSLLEVSGMVYYSTLRGKKLE